MPDGSAAPERAQAFLGSAWLAALLTAAVAALAVLTGVQAYDAVDTDEISATEPEQSTDAAVRGRLLVEATEVSELVLTYRHERFQQDVAAAGSRLTPEFRQEYDAAMQLVRRDARRNKISQDATASSSAVISATADQAKVLVFLNQETTSARTGVDQQVRIRLVVDLVPRDGGWAIAGVSSLG